MAEQVKAPSMAFYTEDIFGDAVVSEVNEEFNLPEYEPEIKKILRVTARILPAGKYIGAGKAEFAGSVIYGVIYLGSEGEIGSVNLSSDWELAVPFPETDGECAVYASVRADNVTCRPTGPRRLSFRTRLKSRIEMYDIVVKEKVRNAILKIHKERNTTIFLTSHDLGDIERICKRIIIIDKGRIIKDESVSFSSLIFSLSAESVKPHKSTTELSS